jgi:DNA polymerase-3 subunit delta
MKANKAQLDKALKDPAGTRFFLFYGPDEAGSRALAKTIAAAMPADAERIDLSGSDLKGDPARLADEAASISMFGGARYVIVDTAGDEATAAVEALASATTAGNPVALVAGALRPTSKLLKLALADKNAVAFVSYPLDARDGSRLTMDLGREVGLSIRQDVARRICESAASNRALIALELQKFALFLDAAPERPRSLDHDTIDAVGAANDEGDPGKLVEAVAGGKGALLQTELDRLAAEGTSGIPLIRALLRRLTLLARLRGEFDRTGNIGAVMASQGKAIFFREKPAIEAELSRWPSDLLAKAIDRLGEAERQVKASGGMGDIAADEELFAICRQAARLR